MAKPAVFISSTCRDLAAHRERIVGRLTSMGLLPIYSESTEFPVRHALSATESCYQAVEEAADVMILVLGSRYGSLDSNGLSVTHNEYLKARAAGLPVLVLVDKSLMDLVPVVKANPDIDLTNRVDSMQLFGFLDELLGADHRWVFSYSRLEEVEQIVVDQLAVLFGEGLALYRQLMESADSELLALMGAKSRRLLLARGDFWEYDLLASLLDDYFGGVDIRFRELEIQYGYSRESLEIGDDVDFTAVGVEFSASCGRVMHILGNWSVLIGKAMNDALGEPGVAGEAPKLIFTARRLADLYVEFLDEFNRMARYQQIERLETLSRAYMEMLSPALQYIGDTPAQWRERVERIREAVATNATALDIDFIIPSVGPDEFNTQLKLLASGGGA